MADEDHGDYWMQIPSAPKPQSLPNIEVLRVSDVVPLDPQFGVEKPLSIPEALADLMFGSSDLIKPSCDLDSQAELQTFVILDAAKIPNLVEMLEVSSLESRCLFIGEAQEELKHVAPWIVRLDQQAELTRNLFTQGKAPWHLWSKDPGIYIRSAANLDRLWTHLRKFTRVQDEQGKWFYWRFWEARALFAFLGEKEFTPMAQKFLKSFQSLSKQTLLIVPQGTSVNVIALSEASIVNGNQKDVVLTEQDRDRLREELRQRDAFDLAGFLATQPVFGKCERPYLNDLSLRALKRRDLLGVRSPNGIAWIVIVTFLADRNSKAKELASRLFNSRSWRFDQIARMLKRGTDKAGETQTEDK